jgi:hypothetical protein
MKIVRTNTRRPIGIEAENQRLAALIVRQAIDFNDLRDALRPFAECSFPEKTHVKPEDQWPWTTGHKTDKGINLRHILNASAVYAATTPVAVKGKK